MPTLNKKTSARKRKTSANKKIKFWASVIITVILYFMQQQGKPLSQPDNMETSQVFNNVSIASVYDGDTFKINLNCSLAVYCEKVPVRVRGVDTPEIKGKTEREKKLAQKAKEFTKNFLNQEHINLSDCSRDKYFRLLCDVKNGQGKDLARELIKNDLGYSYDGGTKSNKYQ